MSAESKEQAIEAVIRKIQADPDVSVRSLLLHDASEAHALKILTLFSVSPSFLASLMTTQELPAAGRVFQ